MNANVGKSTTPMRAAVVIFIALLTMPTVISAQVPSSTEPSAVPYPDYGLSTLSSNGPITLSAIDRLTDSNTSVPSLEALMQSQLLPYGIRQILLDIGWQNFTVGGVPFEPWVANWLTASDQLGIQDIIFAGQLTNDGVGSPWVKDVIQLDPAAQTYYSNGTAAEYISFDSPDVAHYLESDLSLLHSYYGNFTSWTGIGTGSPSQSPYYTSGQAMPIMGYSNSTIANFLDSVYYAGLVNGSGYLQDGGVDPLWSSYKNISSSIILSSGVWDTSSPTNVYGAGSSSSYVEMRFYIPNNETELQIGWYGNIVGTPGPLAGQIFADSNGSIDLAHLLGSVNESASQSTSETGWQSGLNFLGNFSAGFYWVTFSSPASDNESHYSVYVNNYVVNSATAIARQAYIGPGFLTGTSILWIKNQTGSNIAVYPYEQIVVTPPNAQIFTAEQSFSFNTVFLFLADRVYNPTNGTLIVQDMTNGNKTVATGVLSQNLVHGLQVDVPVSLNTTVAAVAGHKYSITVTEPGNGVSWKVVMRALYTDPSVAGFQNQSTSLLFGLAKVNWVQGHIDFTGITSNGGSPVTSGEMNAVRIIPDSNETLHSVQFLTHSEKQGVNYTSGEFTVGIWASNPTDSEPVGPALQEMRISATDVPLSGLLNVSGFSQDVTAGTAYWLVFSTSSNESITFARLTSTYAYLVLTSTDGGSKWTQLVDGPTEFSFVATLSEQTIGNYIAGFPTVPLSPTSDYAQPFYANSTSEVDGIFLGPLQRGAYLQVSIVPTNTNGMPSNAALATATYNANDITLDFGLEFVQLSSVARLQAGTEYWIVIHPINSTYQVSPIAYLPNAPGVPVNMSSVVSSDGGSTWTRVTNGTSMLSYELTSPIISLPSITTQQIFQDLSANENYSADSGILLGWNAYIQASGLSFFSQVASWMRSNIGRQFDFVTEASPNVLSQVAPPDVATSIAPPSNLSCASLLNELETDIPTQGAQYYNVGTGSSLANCGLAASSLATTLNKVKYEGGYFGTNGGTRVLVVGDAQMSNLTRYLSVAYNTSYVQLSLDPSLGNEGGLSRFAAVVWTSQTSPTSSTILETTILDYVDRGGILIISNGSPSGGQTTTLGTYPAPPSSTLTNQSGAQFLQESIADSTYADTLTLVANSSTSAMMTSPGLSLTAESYGIGRLVITSFNETVQQTSEPVVLISNLIAASEDGTAPFWYGNSPSSGVFGIYGNKGGPILVWLANPTSSTSTISLDLNSTFYGFPRSWTLVDMNGLTMASSSGGDIQINSTLQPYSMQPIFIVPMNPTLVIEYSNAIVERQLTYPDQSLFTLDGVAGQSVITFVQSNSTIGEVLLNDQNPLPEVQSVGAIENASSGWFLDAASHALIVKYIASGTDTLRVLPSQPAPVVATNIPLTSYEKAIALLILAEFTVLIYFVASRRSKIASLRNK